MSAPFCAWMRRVWLAMDVTGTIYLNSAGWLRQGLLTLKGKRSIWFTYEEDRFYWPNRREAVAHLTTEQLHWLLDGIDIEAVSPHPLRQYASAGAQVPQNFDTPLLPERSPG
ncbi:IS66 family insertion sequence element accessory protein TnpB [Rhizobium sp. AB2/73]|uniref:IS66 family insertion sequence element accessory protein TnpB n=1 Tax=Rhizobium sp. AB2/73 TaxID=2795216 RepID=UPI0027DA7527|nr:IS66 family insertion sequence element accessory protein TnpB [Rhizobium sp. AB2/73]